MFFRSLGAFFSTWKAKQKLMASPIGSMWPVYLLTFSIQINQMWVKYTIHGSYGSCFGVNYIMCFCPDALFSIYDIADHSIPWFDAFGKISSIYLWVVSFLMLSLLRTKPAFSWTSSQWIFSTKHSKTVRGSVSNNHLVQWKMGCPRKITVFLHTKLYQFPVHHDCCCT